MGVKNMRRVELQYFESRPAEKDKSFGIVGVITFRRAVRVIAVEILVGADEINGDAAGCRP